MVQRNARVSLKPGKCWCAPTGKSRTALTITHPNAAGIDIGSTAHLVSAPPDRDDAPVRGLHSFTVDLYACRLAQGLRGRHRRHGIHRRVLDPLFRAAGVARHYAASSLGPANPRQPCEQRICRSHVALTPGCARPRAGYSSYVEIGGISYKWAVLVVKTS